MSNEQNLFIAHCSLLIDWTLTAVVGAVAPLGAPIGEPTAVHISHGREHNIPSRNVVGVNYKGTHISLRFRNNSSGESLQLQALGIGMVKLLEQ